MYSIWFAHSTKDMRKSTRDALLTLNPNAVMEHIGDPIELRRRSRQEKESLAGVILGPSENGISDENLAAALHEDGVQHIVLCAYNPSGSMRSRAMRAGVETVVDLSELAWAARRPNDAHPELQTAVVSKRYSEDELSKQEEEQSSEPKTGVLPRVDAYDPRSVSYEMDESHSGQAPFLVFASGRGGVGKTTLASTTAALCASWGMRTALLDLDLSCGNAFSYLGVGQPIDIARILADGKPSAESMGRSSTKAKCGVNLWGPCERPELADAIYTHIKELIDYVRSRFDVVIADTSTTFTDAVAEAAQSCTRLYLVHDAIAGGLGPIVRTNSLALRLGVARTRIVRVENGAPDNRKRQSSDFSEDMALDGMASASIDDGGLEVAELLGAGNIEELLLLDNPMVTSLSRLIAKNLSDLGALPDSDLAKSALSQQKHKGFSLFKKKAKS